MGLDFEFDDETVLKISSGAVGVMGLAYFAAPDVVQDNLFTAIAGSSVTHMRCAGHALAFNGIQGFSVSTGDDANSKKNLLKIHGAGWTTAVALNLANVYHFKTANETNTLISSAPMAVLGALCLWRGFKDE